MTLTEHRELFTNSFYEWLEGNGVTLTGFAGMQFSATVDLNKLKVGMSQLIIASGGSDE